MQFKGQLLLPDDTGPGLRVNLDVAAHHLAVESDGGGLGAWPLEVVEVERRGDVFALTVAGEALDFVADDTIAFAYSGVPTIERVTGGVRARSGLRSILGRIWNGPVDSAPPSDDEQSAGEPDRQDPPAEATVEAVVTQPDRTAEAIAEITDALRDFNDIVDDGVEAIPPIEAPRPDFADDPAFAPGCPAIRSDGRRCESPILTSSGYCYPHDPKRAFEDKYQAAQKARARLKRDSTDRLNRIYGRLDKAMRQVERGELDPEMAVAMAQIANTMCAILGIEEPSQET